MSARAARLVAARTPLDTAIALLARGFWVAVIRPGEKRPIGNGWGLERLTHNKIGERFRANPKAGVGVCLGPGRAPGGSWLVDLEGDGERAGESLTRLFGGELVESLGWSSTRGSHLLLSIDADRLLPLLARLQGCEVKRAGQPGVYKLPDLPDLELRIGGYKDDGSVKQLQSVVPPTLGTDGKPRAWNGVETVAKAPESLYAALEQLAKANTKTESSGAVAQRNGHANGLATPDRDSRRPDVETRAIAYLAKCEPAISGQGGHNQTFGVACRVGPGFDLEPDVAFRLLMTEFNPRCQPPWSEAEIRHKVEDAYRVEQHRGWLLEADRHSPHRGNGNGKGKATNRRVVSDGDGKFNLTDLGNAERLASRHGADFRHVHPWSKWLSWDGKRWAIDSTGRIGRAAKDTVRQIYAEAATASTETDREAIAKFAMASESRKAVEAMIALARAELPADLARLDRDPWLLNCRNGTLDLRTAELRPHRREDLITKLCPVAYDPEAKAPLWEQTIQTVFAGNDRLVAFWQRLCGVVLTGDVSEQVLPILHGVGANGKSTILNVMLEVLGPDYAMKAPPDLLLARRQETHPTERADLFGKRLVVAIETGDGARLNETLIKELTGGDKIRARRMREDFWEFNPTHKVLLCTNHRPDVRGTDHAIWRRLKLVPFNVIIPDEKQDKRLPAKLKKELPGILAWSVRGCVAWQEVGLNPPEEVAEATREYRQEQDVLAAFLADECLLLTAAKCRASQLYERYKQWTERSGETAANQRRFGRAMTERGFARSTNNGTWYEGIGLRQTDP